MKHSICWISSSVALIFLVIAPTVSAANKFEITCPSRVSLDPVTVHHVPDGWSASQQENTLDVQGTGMNVGPLNEMEVLKPDIDTVKGITVFSWEFDKTDNAKGIWLSCGYGYAVVLLSQKLPSGLTKCRAYGPTSNADGYPIEHVVCN
jgi:hypothetical protein